MRSDDTVEVNFDGLIGPSHNYAGMSDGNLASQIHAGHVSSPRQAALQGLEKMRALVRAGLVQAVLPPLPRPDFGFLQQVGFSGREAEMIEAAGRQAPGLLRAAYSASAMWTANAATVSPASDTQDGRLHLSVANLSAMLHRSIEPPHTYAALKQIFRDETVFAVHPALPCHEMFADEGAANHVRLCAEHAGPGVELFVYGREAGEHLSGFPGRQTLQASQAVARRHGLEPHRTVFARQSSAAINAGAFHNDVVCVGTCATLFFHEKAFEETQTVLSDLETASQGLFEFKPVMVPEAEVPLKDAIRAYLFNSQLLVWPGEDRLVLLAPLETKEMDSTAAYCARLVEGNGPIGRVVFADVRQSMNNGGGPACLRLRVVMTAAQRRALHPGIILDDAKIDQLQAVIRETYRDSLTVSDLADPAFSADCQTARQAVLQVLELEGL